MLLFMLNPNQILIYNLDSNHGSAKSILFTQMSIWDNLIETKHWFPGVFKN